MASSTRNGHQQRQANRDQTPWEKRVLSLPVATTVDALLLELEVKNPGLSTLFVARPRMLSPKVVLLCFAGDAYIPSHIMAFGGTQIPRLYKESALTAGMTSTSGSSVQTSVDSPAGSIYTLEGSVDSATSGSVPSTAGSELWRRRS